MLWEALRDRPLAGREFRRQHPVGRFVLDFYCYEERLAVEVDGGVHAAQEEADWERQSVAEAMGIRVVRVPAGLVENDPAQGTGAYRSGAESEPLARARERGLRVAEGVRVRW